MAEPITETIGCDLSDRSSTLFLITPEGQEKRLPPIKTTRADMRAFFSRRSAHVILEAGTHSRWVSLFNLQPKAA